MRCLNVAETAFATGDGSDIRERGVCHEHAARLNGGDRYASEGRALLLEGDIPTSIQRMTIHVDAKPEFTVTLEHGLSSEDTQALTLRMPLWARRLLHSALSSRLEDEPGDP